MNVPQLLSTLMAEGILVRVEKDRIRYKATNGKINDGLKALIQERSSELFAYLNDDTQGASGLTSTATITTPLTITAPSPSPDLLEVRQEIVELMARWMQGEKEALAGWPDASNEQLAYKSFQAIAKRTAELVEVLDTECPALLEGLTLFPEPER